jgi:hypothetical protein
MLCLKHKKYHTENSPRCQRKIARILYFPREQRTAQDQHATFTRKDGFPVKTQLHYGIEEEITHGEHF